jgi:cell division protein FtsW (lipid II flippase)
MSEKSPAAQKGRQFAITVAIGFGVLALVALWRDRQLPMWIFASVAVLLVLAGLAIPHKLSGLERAWMKLAHAISKITTPIFMSIIYFVVLTPAGVIRRMSGGNPLVHRAIEGSYWIGRRAQEKEKARRQMERQF